MTTAYEWMNTAACRGHQHLFFPPNDIHERPSVFAAREARAVALCQVCPVLDECARWAIENRRDVRDAIVAGTTPGQRGHEVVGGLFADEPAIFDEIDNLYRPRHKRRVEDDPRDRLVREHQAAQRAAEHEATMAAMADVERATGWTRCDGDTKMVDPRDAEVRAYQLSLGVL